MPQESDEWTQSVLRKLSTPSQAESAIEDLERRGAIPMELLKRSGLGIAVNELRRNTDVAAALRGRAKRLVKGWTAAEAGDAQVLPAGSKR